ncbi:Ion_trans_2 domain-containing protein [Azospirillaceae bacterium]
MWRKCRETCVSRHFRCEESEEKEEGLLSFGVEERRRGRQALRFFIRFLSVPMNNAPQNHRHDSHPETHADHSHRPDHHNPHHLGGRHGSSRFHREWIRAVVLSALLLSVISVAIKAVAGTLAFVLLGTIVFVIAVFHRIFPGSHFFTLALVNFIGIYACLFTVIVESHFPHVSQRVQALGFVLPLLAFLVGACSRARTIRSIVASKRLRRHEANVGEAFLWLAPLVGMIVITLFLPTDDEYGVFTSFWFLLMMLGIAVFVVFVSRNIALFLVDAGLMFEDFFREAARMIMPAFAFLTFYSLLVIVFAAVYASIERFSLGHDFMVDGVFRKLSFSEALYFSIVTLSTVGYGDIQPHSEVARLFAALEIVMGLLLLLFGFSAVIRFTPSADRPNRRDEI